MGWAIELAQSADRELAQLDPPQRKRILTFLRDRLARLGDPRSIGQALRGEKLGEFWKYRVGDYRLIASIEDRRVLILILRIGHRRQVYR